jgi:hypothetical protein
MQRGGFEISAQLGVAEQLAGSVEAFTDGVAAVAVDGCDSVAEAA